MELASLKKCLSKLKVEEMLTAVTKWKYLKRNEVNELKSLIHPEKKTPKQSIISDIIGYFEKKGRLTMEVVGEFDLICMEMFSTSKQWSAYQVSEKDNITDVTRSPDVFKSRLKKQIRLYFKKEYAVSVILNAGLLWGRVYFSDKNKKVYNPRQNLYFIYYPDSPVVIFNGLKQSTSEFACQCLLVSLGYGKIKELCLTGRHYQSLAELAINKFMPGGYARYSQLSQAGGPLNTVTSRKRKASCLMETDSVTDLNRAEKLRRVEVVDKTFGQNIQPTLEKVQFKVMLPYRSKQVATELHDDGEQFHSCVKFQGTSVLEGLRNLAMAGMATTPLPKHLTIISGRARNCFILSTSDPGNAAHATQNNNTAIVSQKTRENTTRNDTPKTTRSRRR